MKNKKQTNRVFYNKWPYKVEGRLNGVYAVVRCKTKSFEKLVENWKKWRTPQIDIPEVTAFKDLYMPLANELDITCRSSGESFIIYCLNEADMNKVSNVLGKWVHTEYSPDAETLQFMQIHSATQIRANKLPHGKFKFKVSITASTPLTIREQFLSWSNNLHPDVLLISKTTKSWLAGKEKSWKSAPRFLYVNNAANLLLVRLYLGTAIRRIEEYMPVIDINTPSGT